VCVAVALTACEAASDPERAEYIEIFNQPLTETGEPNRLDIVYVRIVHENVGSGWPHTRVIRPGESLRFSVLWPGDYSLRIRYEDEHESVVTEPEMPFYVYNADTRQVYVWYDDRP
jgi:hypothetical protein